MVRAAVASMLYQLIPLVFKVQFDTIDNVDEFVVVSTVPAV